MTKSINGESMNFKSLEEATGEILYGMTNDYMFRAVLQSNNIVLRGLIAALLYLSIDEIISVEITNPIVIGKALTGKEFRLDVHVILNNHARINLEMQVINLYNWENRSLSYLCRLFDNLTKGKKYNEVQPAIHIGILNYTLFPEIPEFYAKHKMMNIKNHHVYSDNFMLNVLDLTQIDLATDEDKLYQLDYWARLLKTTTWEGLKLMASENEVMQEACNTIFQLSTDEEVRKLCRDREDYYADRQYLVDTIAEKDNIIEEKDNELAEKKHELYQAKAEIERLKAQIIEQQK